MSEFISWFEQKVLELPSSDAVFVISKVGKGWSDKEISTRSEDFKITIPKVQKALRCIYLVFAKELHGLNQDACREKIGALYRKYLDAKYPRRKRARRVNQSWLQTKKASGTAPHP